GVSFVANSLITSEKLYKKRPGLVKKFTQAVIKGWQEALSKGHEQDAAKAIHEMDETTPIEINKRQLAATRSLVLPQNGKGPIGRIDKKAWQETEDIMMAQGLMHRYVNLQNLLAGPPP
ncbi:MAG: ABC transporter substrate-binding protein, partial [Dissulfurimicrobium sp.]